MTTTQNTVVSRGTTVPFAELPAKSIALDGYCQGPAVDVEGERFSFDHHAGCLRLITSATCKQVFDAILLGFDPTDYTIYINDVDGDTVLSVWLLRNAAKVAAEPCEVRDLVEAVSAIDAHGPAYPTDNALLVDKFFQGVMAPEVAARRNKTFQTANLDEMLESCVDNVSLLLDGGLGYRPKTDERGYEITHTGNGWVMAKSNDFIFDLLYAAGHTRAVAYQRLSDGSYAYTVAKKSELVSHFPVGPANKEGNILYALNAREPGWGGGSTIGGAPRNADGSRSHLTPDEVFQIVEGVIKNNR